MTDETLFHKYDLRLIIDRQRADLKRELDAMADNRLLNTDVAELQSWAVEKFEINLPVLGDPVVDEGRTKMKVGRYGESWDDGGPSVQVDAQRYTLEIPFEGDSLLFFTQGSAFNSMPPRGKVGESVISTTLVERNPTAERLNQHFDRFLSDVNKYLGWLRGDIDSWNASIANEVAAVVGHRKQRAEQAGTVASGLKYEIKSRTDRAATFAVPVAQRKKISLQLPLAKPGAPPEPMLADETYRAILDTLKQMSLVMERSPHAFAEMDEEKLRFHFLVPLNAQFEGEARGEVFNFGGKTDVLITINGKNIFIGECKFWSGAKALLQTVDQVLGYLAWRDTKCAILLFNRNKDFSQVVAQIRPTIEQHPQFVSFDGCKDETEMTFTLKRPDDPQRRLKLTVTAFDIPAGV